MIDYIDNISGDIEEDDFVDLELISQEIDTFLVGFFAKAHEIIEFEKSQIKLHSFIEPSVDYIRIRRFLISAINNLKVIDSSLVKGLLAKLYKDEELLYDAYIEYQSLNRITSIVFEKNFLSTQPQYKELQREISLNKANISGLESTIKSVDAKLLGLTLKLEDDPTSKDLESEIKHCNTRLANSYHNLAKLKEKLASLVEEMKYFKKTLADIFKTKYESCREEYFVEWKKIINIKCYYLDKLLWFEASESKMVQKFFLNADIDGNYDIKTFIKYYIKNIDIEKSKDTEWHNYLLSTLKVLD